jgi:hypothetical protein
LFDYFNCLVDEIFYLFFASAGAILSTQEPTEEMISYFKRASKYFTIIHYFDGITQSSELDCPNADTLLLLGVKNVSSDFLKFKSF